jgi:pyruvate dehydrogenase E1 component beta subunit
MHMPGIKVVIPSNPYDAKGLLHAAIEDPDPVLFLEHMKLYRSFRQEVPAERYTIPLGKAALVQEGTDVTVIAYGAMVQVARKAAVQAEEATDASIEVIDLRTISPFDEETIAASVNKTGRVVIVHEDIRTGGVGAEIAAFISEHCLYSLLKPIERVTCPDIPFPVPKLEDHFIPTPERVKEAICRVLEP